MRIVLGIQAEAGVALSIVAAASNASGAPAVRSALRPPAAADPAHHRHARRIHALVAGCLGAAPLGPGSFIGAGTGNSVSGAYSGDISGEYNVICTAASAIGAGADNNISGQYGESFIGAGFYNLITGNDSFVGAGGSLTGYVLASGNTVAGTDACIGAGDSNYSSGNGSFIGAGGLSGGFSGRGLFQHRLRQRRVSRCQKRQQS